MNRRERVMATVRGESVDRPAVSFYEINGLDENPADPNPFNIYSDPSWAPLIQLAREKTDRIIMRSAELRSAGPSPFEELAKVVRHDVNGSLFTETTVKVGRRVLTSRTRRDPDIDTNWRLEHLLKDTSDLKAFLQIPPANAVGTVVTSGVLEAEAALGDTGIVMIDIGDPLCNAAPLFSMEDYTVIALTEPVLFRRLLDWFAESMLADVSAAAQALPGRLWRICGPEYASEPFLPPSLFREYVCGYDRPIIEAIHRTEGFARIHSHGRLSAILDDIVGMGADGLDPIEPPPQGDVELSYVRERFGRQLVLFGNLEVTDIENLPTDRFALKVKRAIDEGTSGEGRGFVLMPSACPYGRKLSSLALRNYEKMIELIEAV